MMRAVSALVMLAGAAPALAGVRLPAELHGIWDVSLAACADGEMVEGVKISATGLAFYEGTIDPLRLTKEAARSFTIVGNWDEHGGNDRTTLTLKLSNDGNRISISYEGGTPTNLLRCTSPALGREQALLRMQRTVNA